MIDENGNIIEGLQTFREASAVTIKGKNNKIIIHESANLGAFKLEIVGNNCTFSVGENCKFRGMAKLEGDGAKIILADNSTATGVKLLALEGKTIAIGQDCMISFNIEMRTSDAHALLDLETRKRTNLPDDILIAEHVWVGARSVIGKGAYIGPDNVIGQGSLINKRFDVSHCVIAGVPAKVIREGVTWDRDPATGM